MGAESYLIPKILKQLGHKISEVAPYFHNTGWAQKERNGILPVIKNKMTGISGWAIFS